MNSVVDAVLVTFEPEETLSKTLKALKEQVRNIYIIDNSANSNFKKKISFLIKDINNIILINNKANLGIAEAQNMGIKLAVSNKADWILLLDQDSVPEKNMIQKMLKKVSSRSNEGNYFFIAPIILDRQTSQTSRYFLKNGFLPISNKMKTLEVNRVIASGSLIHKKVFKKIGLLRSNFFIDYVDFDFCLRATLNNFKIKLENSVSLIHEQGKKTTHKLGPFKIITHNYSSLRRYYIFRNRIYFVRLYFKNYPKILLHETLACCFDVFRILCFEKNKRDKFKKIIKGILDGFLTEIPTYEKL